MREAEKKRLVKLIRDGDSAFADKYPGKVMSHIDELYGFIADYLLDNGIIVPPCKVGDTIYDCGNGVGVRKSYVGGFEVYEDKVIVVDFIDERYDAEQFGKTVFLSEAEAEYALKNRRSVSLVNGHIEE